jgi:iron complex outermembrane receptor protein
MNWLKNNTLSSSIRSILSGTQVSQARPERNNSIAVLVRDVGCALALASCTSAYAASQDAGEAVGNSDVLAEVTVTAEKISTNLQRTPIAVTALSASRLDQEQAHNIEDLEILVPGLKAGDEQGFAQFTIRGIGTTVSLAGAEAPVAVNLNGVYLSRTSGQLSGLFDVSQVEVLRGPQGTLYGRNATAGAVNISTALPTNEVSGYVDVTGGNYGEARLESAVGGPLIGDTLLGRIAVFGERHDGYGTNLATGTGIDDKGAYGIRSTLVFEPNSAVKATLFAEYYRENDHNGSLHYLGAAGLSGLPGALGLPPLFVSDGGTTARNVADVANGIDPRFYLRTGAVTAAIEWHPTDAFNLKSITGYRDQQAAGVFPFDGGIPLNAFTIQGEPARQISQEFDAHYQWDKIQVTGGLYYFHENDDVTPLVVPLSTYVLNRVFAIPYPTAYFVNFGTVDSLLTTQAEAAFIQGTYDVTSKLSLTAGVRYSVEKKGDTQFYGVDLFTPYTGNNPLPPGVRQPSKDFYATTPRFGIQYQLDPTTLLYATYAQGFKAGGFDVGVQNPAPYRPERLTDYEGGLKTTLFNGHFRMNLTGFYYDYKDLQVQQVVGLTVQTANAATAKIYGSEAEFAYLVTEAFQVDANFAYAHARYGTYVGPDPAQPLIGNVDFSGHALNNAPNFTGLLSPQYTWHLGSDSVIVRAEVQYSSRYYFSPSNLAQLSQGGYAKENLFATYRSNANWEATAYVKNISDQRTKLSAEVADIFVQNPVLGSISPPRLAGVELKYKF